MFKPQTRTLNNEREITTSVTGKATRHIWNEKLLDRVTSNLLVVKVHVDIVRSWVWWVKVDLVRVRLIFPDRAV